MTFDVADGDECPVVSVVGELDLNTVPGLEAALAPLVSDRPPRLAVDASQLDFVDSSAIALWVRWSNLVGRLEIRDPTPPIRASLVRLGLAHRLWLTPNPSPSPAMPADSSEAVVATSPPPAAPPPGPTAAP